jgi:hypothetical protein
MYRLLACLVLAVFAGPAAACINDTELPGHEREFRSHYLGPAVTPPPPSTSAEPPDYQLMYGGGVALLVGAAVVALTGGGRRR